MQRARTTYIQGSILIQVMAFMSIGIVILSGFVGWSVLSVRIARHTEYREQAIQIAEAGIDYYRWHLAHAPFDYQDGTGIVGPYVHDYYDKQGNKLGSFTLNIIPPPVGSTLVVIDSTGKVVSDATATRTIEAKLEKPSFAKFALVTNEVVWEDAVEIFGPYHSNGGVHFSNVLAHNIVTSAQTTYIDPDFGGTRWGVYTDKGTVDPAPPTALPNRPDVFAAGRVVAVPAVDFVGMMSDLASIKTNAQTLGLYYGPSGALGYHIVLKPTGQFDIYRVTGKLPSPNGACAAGLKFDDAGGDMWSINAEVLITANVAVPANGLIFTEDDVWVEGTINTEYITIAAARFPDNPLTRANIIVNNDIRYTNVDGSDVIGLIAQNYIRIGYASADVLHIDGALVAQSGAIWRDYYPAACGPQNIRTRIETNGSLISNRRYTFSWWCGAFCSGYAAQVSTYDANMLYRPPPSFPLTTDRYQTVSWSEK